MPKILNDFTCPDCGTTEEHFVDSSVKTIRCSSCGGQATKKLSLGNFHLDPVKGDFPGATSKWARDRQKKLEKERKANS